MIMISIKSNRLEVWNEGNEGTKVGKDSKEKRRWRDGIHRARGWEYWM